MFIADGLAPSRPMKIIASGVPRVRAKQPIDESKPR
jgi:hypothetical protein